MQNRIISNCLKNILVATLAIFSGSLFADGYRNPPPTAEGIGKGGANMVHADDASAISYNPANLAFQTNISVVLSTTFASMETTFKSSSPFAGNDEATTEGSWQALPNLYASLPVMDGLVFGLGITTPFGQSIEYNKYDLMNLPAFAGGTPPAIHEAEISLVNFNPTLAVGIGDRIGIGVGADIYYSTLKFKQYYPWSAGPFPFDQNAEADADGYGVGGNAAVSWNITERQRLALTYRSEVKVEYEGDLEVDIQGVAVPPQMVDSDFEMDIKYPTIIGGGYGIVLTDAISLEANLEWLEWSVNETQVADLGANGTLRIPQKWKDTITVSAGGSWNFAPGWVGRAGYAYIESPIPDKTIAPILPDADRHVLSVGVGYTIKNHSFDIAYAYSIYEDREVSNNQNPAFNGDYDINSDLLGLTYSLSF